MALKRNVYNVLEQIVGPDNISEEPALLDAYAFQWGARALTGKLFAVRYEAVVLPGSTEEVQAIVKACNRYGIKFKALSTGWGFYNAPDAEGAIQLDMRRMDRILEINEKSMYAVIEPYVIGGELQAELMKRGLTCNIIGAGANTTALPLGGHVGVGHTSLSTSYHNRNILSVEWVLPSGDILKLGSLGSGVGWFCGDGPGPSLRGILRGYSTPMGGFGVYTKAATKIYPWLGPTDMQIDGSSPNYKAKLPDTFAAHYITFPTWEKLIEAGYKVGESEIALAFTKLTPWMLAQNIAKSNREGAKLFLEIWHQTLDKGHSILVIIGTDSKEKFQYSEKVLRQIVAETDGEFLSLVEGRDIQESLTWRIIRHSASSREVFRPTGLFMAGFGCLDSWSFAITQALEGEVLKKKYIKNGLIVNDGADNAWGVLYEQGHMGHMDQLLLGDPTLAESVEELEKFHLNSQKICLEKPCGWPQPMGDKANDKFGPRTSNYNVWARKVKKVFDPNDIAEASRYISAKE